ncbi:hypothetical protein ACFTWN_01485 [Streptomyces sp. NPDC057092]|uniref:hypothetical protein n=1 Tax=Streptomyces sp. NPDC057092 TaxID=3346017 RepID=UPI0036437C8B
MIDAAERVDADRDPQDGRDLLVGEAGACGCCCGPSPDFVGVSRHGRAFGEIALLEQPVLVRTAMPRDVTRRFPVGGPAAVCLCRGRAGAVPA